MGLGHVLGQGRVSPLKVASAIEGDSLALEEGLDRGVGETDIDPFVDQPVGDTIVVVIHLNMVIDIDLGPAPVGLDESMGRQGFESRFVQALKQAPSGGWEFFKGAAI
jgi:hypothetical protein